MTRPATSPERRPRRFGALALVLTLTATACSEDDDRSAPKAEPGTVPAHEQRPGDARAGYETILAGRYVTCGPPYPAWQRAGGASDSAPRLADREPRNRALPYYFSRHENDRGQDIVSTNCLYCHADEFNGELVIGLGNETRDFTSDPREGVNAIGNYVTGDRATAAWRKWAERVSAMAPYMITDTVGVNPAPNLTLALMAHRDPETLAWLEEPGLEPPPERPLPTSVPPWWRMGKKHALFYNAMGRGDHARYMMMKSLVCTDSVEQAEEIDATFTDVRAYLASLEPPEYPFAIDRSLAEQGEAVFETNCARCHGSYGDDESYPNRVVGLDVVGTDPAYAQRAYEDSDRFMNWFNKSWYGEIATARPAPGYIAPPLDGIWATAPFLHNGSVPTIRGLLDSSQRPTFWKRTGAEPAFDEEAVGWEYTPLDHGKEGAGDAAERKRIYDTTRPGYSNDGHTFGDQLTDEQRRAVLEYLKTL